MYGLALEGGGTRGAAHVGVLRALIEEGLPPSRIAGTSAGAIVAAAYAWRGRLEDAQEALAQCARLDKRLLDPNLGGMIRGVVELITRKNFRLDGVFKGNRLQRWMYRFTQGALVKDAAIPLSIPAVDLYSGKIVAFSSRAPMRPTDEIWKTDARMDEAVRASTAIPVAFRPFQYQNLLLVDGGLLENLPTDTLLASGAARVLGIVLEVPGETKPIDDVLSIGLHSIYIMQARLLDAQIAAAQWVLRVRLPEGSGIFSFDALAEYEEIGYRAAKEAMADIRRYLGIRARPGMRALP